MLTELEIRNNSPVEIAQCNGKPIKIKSLSANDADQWLKEWAGDLERQEVHRSKLQERLNELVQDSESTDQQISDVRSELFEANTQYAQTIRQALQAFDSKAFNDNVVNELTHGQLIHCITEVVQLTDPLALVGLLRILRTKELRKELNG